MKTLKVIIEGIVQGVFFRQFIKDNADKLDVRGFVRNLNDGKIEVVMEGKNKEVEELLNRCKKGPTHSEIRNIQAEEMRHQGFSNFKIFSI